ncbi:MAG: DMT family transporter [Anaerolineae bacterium]|nr:DMT family transporter [Anaerolineae bacterium]
MNNSELGSIVFGLISAASWGAGDFSGGLATKRANVYGVVVISQVVGVICLIVLALLLRETIPPFTDWVWGGAAGIAGALGILCLYRALATTRMGIAAPVSAVVTATVPVIFAIFTQGLPATYKLIGFVIALIAVWLTSQSDGGRIRVSDLTMPLLAGIGFGSFLILIDQGNDVSVLWSLVAARFASIVMMIGVIATTRQAWRPAAPQLKIIGLAGILDTGGNLFYSLAAQTGYLAQAAVLSSLYPAATVMLALMILREKLHRVQMLGVVLAVVAIALIAV